MGLPKGYTPALAPAQRAKAIHAGLLGGGAMDDPLAGGVDAKESKALRDKRKKERQAKKKARKGRR